MKVIVSYSGGKDSQASLLWTLSNLTKTPIVVFCDTGWEHPLTYQHLEETTKALGLELVTVKSKKYDGMVDLARQKKRWPSGGRRFCTMELKSIPVRDWVLDNIHDDIIVVEGVRGGESFRRSLMSKQCTYFKYYFEPYGHDKKGKPKYHTYRSKDVREFRSKYADDLLRPVFDWSAQQVMDYIIENGQEPNPLYRMGYKRVGCWPCIMSVQQDVLNIVNQSPERLDYIAEIEREIESSFFGSDKIPARAIRSGAKYPLISDVVQYIKDRNSTGSLFDDDAATSCMSFYGLCE